MTKIKNGTIFKTKLNQKELKKIQKHVNRGISMSQKKGDRYRKKGFYNNINRSILRTQISGILGEIVYKKYLDSQNIKYQYCGGGVDDYDFVHGGDLIEVKTIGVKQYKNIELWLEKDYYTYSPCHIFFKLKKNSQYYGKNFKNNTKTLRDKVKRILNKPTKHLNFKEMDKVKLVSVVADFNFYFKETKDKVIINSIKNIKSLIVKPKKLSWFVNNLKATDSVPWGSNDNVKQTFHYKSPQDFIFTGKNELKI